MTTFDKEKYERLKKYAEVVEEICADIDLHAHGFNPGILFAADGYSLDLPEWFLRRLYEYVNTHSR